MLHDREQDLKDLPVADFVSDDKNADMSDGSNHNQKKDNQERKDSGVIVVEGIVVHDVRGEKRKEKQKDRAGNNVRKLMFILGFFFIAVAGSASIPIVQMFTTDKTLSKPLAPTSAPKQHQTLQPSTSRYIQLLNILIEVSAFDALTDYKSPQYKALYWLAYVDQTPIDAPNLVQRYILVVFYFSMNGDDWFVCSDKFGCKCRDRVNMPCQEIEKRHTPQLFLENECNWFNYRCDRNENRWVTQIDFGSASGNGLTGRIPSEIRYLTKLQFLTLENNAISGSIPDVLGNMTNLLSVSFSWNQLTGSIPESIFDCTSLRYVSFKGNRMVGTISPSFNKLQRLKIIALEDNFFGGSIPSVIGNITTLESFVIRNNEFVGSLPKEVLRMSNLNVIDTSYNYLSGTIPIETDLPKLEKFIISYNQIQGQIPEEFFLRSNFLSILDVAKNNLSGTISPLMGELPALSFVSLYGNEFKQDLPESLCSKIQRGILDVGCNDDARCKPDECCTCIL